MQEARFEIRLKPRAKSDRLVIREDGMLDVAVTSPPVDDRANDHLIAFLAERLGVPKRSVSIIRGGHSRNKAVAVEGLTREEAIRRINKNLRT